MAQKTLRKQKNKKGTSKGQLKRKKRARQKQNKVNIQIWWVAPKEMRKQNYGKKKSFRQKKRLEKSKR